MGHSSLMKKMSATAIMPQVHRRESLRNEGNAAHKGLHAMFEHANDHLKKKSPFGMLGKGGKRTISLKAMVETAHQEKKVKATEQEHLLRLQLKNSELVMKLKKMPQHKEINGAHLEKMLGQIGLGNKGELRDQILRHLHAHKDGSTTILIGDVVSWVNK